jgi:hypothetical protein
VNDDRAFAKLGQAGLLRAAFMMLAVAGSTLLLTRHIEIVALFVAWAAVYQVWWFVWRTRLKWKGRQRPVPAKG